MSASACPLKLGNFSRAERCPPDGGAPGIDPTSAIVARYLLDGSAADAMKSYTATATPGAEWVPTAIPRQGEGKPVRS